MPESRRVFPRKSSLRQSREFFYVTDRGGVTKVVGYECSGNHGYWWCPEVGVSAAEGYSLFRDRNDAYDAAIARIRSVLGEAQATLSRLEEERWT